MRVAVDAFNLLADRRGMGRFTRTVLQTLRAEPDLELVLVSRNARDAAAIAAESGLEAIALRAASRKKFDAGWFPWNGMRFALAPWNVVTMHDAFAFSSPARGFVARRKEQGPVRRAARDADALTTVSHWSARELAFALRLDAQQFFITPPVPDPLFRPVPERAEGKPFVFALAGPDERKNVAMLVEAWRRAFPDREVDLHLGGTLNERDEALARRAGALRSKPDDETLRTLYAHALLVAVPSSGEGYGLMSVEAMACGAAVVAADAAALPEACDNAALLLPPGDTEAWGRALRELAAQPHRVTELRERSLRRIARIDRTAAARVIAALLRRSREAAR